MFTLVGESMGDALLKSARDRYWAVDAGCGQYYLSKRNRLEQSCVPVLFRSGCCSYAAAPVAFSAMRARRCSLNGSLANRHSLFIIIMPRLSSVKGSHLGSNLALGLPVRAK